MTIVVGVMKHDFRRSRSSYRIDGVPQIPFKGQRAPPTDYTEN